MSINTNINISMNSDCAKVSHLWHCGEWTHSNQTPYYWTNDRKNTIDGFSPPKLTVITPNSLENTLTLSKISPKLSNYNNWSVVYLKKDY